MRTWMTLATVSAARGSSSPSADLTWSQNDATSTSRHPPEPVTRQGIVAMLAAGPRESVTGSAALIAIVPGKYDLPVSRVKLRVRLPRSQHVFGRLRDPDGELVPGRNCGRRYGDRVHRPRRSRSGRSRLWVLSGRRISARGRSRPRSVQRGADGLARGRDRLQRGNDGARRTIRGQVWQGVRFRHRVGALRAPMVR